MLRVFRIPRSTNVERVALAAGHKGLAIDWIDVAPEDRSPVRAASGQDLVPVLLAGDEVVADSTRILEWLERERPDPPLYPRDAPRRAEVETFVDWFNDAWKVAPNRLADEREAGRPTSEVATRCARTLGRSLARFEALLEGRDWLMGDGFGVADAVAFPFLKYGTLALPEGDEEVFHHVLAEHLRFGDARPRLAAWVERVDALPRA